MSKDTTEGVNMMRPKSKKDDVEALLSDFDNLDPRSNRPTASAARTPIATSPVKVGEAKRDDAQSLLDDLDDLVKQRRAPTPKRPVTSSLTSPSSALQAKSPTSLSKPSTPLESTYGARSGSVQADSSNAGHANKPAAQEAPLPVPTDTLSIDGGSSVTFAAASSEPLEAVNTEGSSAPATNASWGGWWSSAQKLADQARAELEKRAAQVQSQVSETTKVAASMGGEGQMDASEEATSAASKSGGTIAAPWQLAQNVNAFLKSHGGDLNKLRSDIGHVGMKRWQEILNVVVPPIESHEVLSITLSHDMLGFDGVPDVVFQILQRVMETHASSQNAEQQIVVNKAPNQVQEDAQDGQSALPVSHEASYDGETPLQQGPDMRPVVGFREAWRLAETRLETLIQAQRNERRQTHATASTAAAGNEAALPITTCPLFIRIQPVLDALPGTTTSDVATHLFVALVLRDPTNNLTHRTISQPLPKQYVSLPFDEHPWAEDLLSESLQGALGSVGLEYVRSRMQARTEALGKATADATQSMTEA